MKKDHIAGIILAGGKSRRFGEPKAFAQLDGKYFYQYQIEVMKAFTKSIVFVSNDQLAERFTFTDSSIRLTTDVPEFAGLGPLAGIFSGMDQVEADWYLVSPIDVPFLEESVFQMLLQHIAPGKDAIVPIVNGRIEPLISIFHASMKEKVKQQLKRRELAPKQLFAKCDIDYIEMKDEKPFRNINFKEDLLPFMED